LFYFALLEDIIVRSCHKGGYMVDQRPL